MDFKSDLTSCRLWKKMGTSCPGLSKCLHLFLEVFLRTVGRWVFSCRTRAGNKRLKKYKPWGLKALQTYLVCLEAKSPGKVNPPASINKLRFLFELSALVGELPDSQRPLFQVAIYISPHLEFPISCLFFAISFRLGYFYAFEST